ncbi:hypothetical protein [Paraburkholderia sp. 40]|uniref:hypothetical protein n=1 Tax=Paraburkholderia sp. 40 TaxID=2991059 RepID=UPI003D260879
MILKKKLNTQGWNGHAHGLMATADRWLINQVEHLWDRRVSSRYADIAEPEPASEDTPREAVPPLSFPFLVAVSTTTAGLVHFGVGPRPAKVTRAI